jgi:hypothetical protein
VCVFVCVCVRTHTWLFLVMRSKPWDSSSASTSAFFLLGIRGFQVWKANSHARTEGPPDKHNTRKAFVLSKAINAVKGSRLHACQPPAPRPNGIGAVRPAGVFATPRACC